MVNQRDRSHGRIAAVLLLATLVLTAAAWLRGAEYDEQYTLFLTAGIARPCWPATVFHASAIPAVQSGQAGLAAIAYDLRTTDVHPPLYFWTISIWRGLIGPDLFTARMFSVLCGIVSLAAVGRIAWRCSIRPDLAMLLTLGSYGFTYTNAVARGFAPAQTLTLLAVALLTGRRTRLRLLTAGALFGAACGCNYLAVFVAATVTVMAGGWLVLPTAIPFLALDAWFFIAQQGGRDGQFPPFSLFTALPRLAEYQIASIFGGLPMYVDGVARVILGSAIAMLALGLLCVVLRAGPLAAGKSVRTLLAAAVAPPIGLLLLGSIFDNTPIELRYLSFGVPFIALLAAWSLDQQPSLRGRIARRLASILDPSRLPAGGLLILVLFIQLISIAGLVASSRASQPAAATALAAAYLANGGVVLVPQGNDGVGIVGAFGLTAPPALPILLVSPTDTPGLIRTRIAAYDRVVVALLAQDRDSIASLPIMQQALAGPGWRSVATGFNVEAYERTAAGE